MNASHIVPTHFYSCSIPMQSHQCHAKFPPLLTIRFHVVHAPSQNNKKSCKTKKPRQKIFYVPMPKRLICLLIGLALTLPSSLAS